MTEIGRTGAVFPEELFSVSQVWVPWRENPGRFDRRGLRAIFWGPLLLVYGAFKRFPSVLFYGGAVGVGAGGVAVGVGVTT